MHDINSRLETLKISVELNDQWFVWGCGAGLGDPYLGGRGGGGREERKGTERCSGLGPPVQVAMTNDS